MGAGSSVIVGDDGIKKEMEKPLDASDLLTLDDAVKVCGMGWPYLSLTFDSETSSYFALAP
jgi:hypothetical protein